MKKKLPWGELGFLLAILAFVLYYFFSVMGFGTRAVAWPYLLMAGTVLCVLSIAVELIRKAPQKTDSDKKLSFALWWNGSSSSIVIIVSFTLYTFLLKELGINICNFLLSFFLYFYISKGKWKGALIAATSVAVVFYLVFGLALGIRLPKFKLF